MNPTSPSPDAAAVMLKSPASCTDEELSAFESALQAAGEAASQPLLERIRRAECLAFVRGANGEMEAVGALKCPKLEHRTALFRRASAQVPPEPFTMEPGWLAGNEKAMPLIVAALVEHAGERPVFVIAGTAETTLQTLLAQQGFRTGSPVYASSHGAYSNQIYVRGN